MPRIANNTDALLRDLQQRMEKLVETARAEGREQALADVRALVGGRSPATRGAASADEPKPRRKSSKPRKNPWATMTPEERKVRVRKMLAGRGLKPKDER